MLKKLNLFAGENNSLSWWWLGIKVGVFSALIIWWWLDQKNKKKLHKISEDNSLEGVKSIPLPDEAPKVKPTQPAQQSTPNKPDDLRKIEGIGPKIQATLQAAGIETFDQLAAVKPEEIKKILTDAGIRIGYPDTWPEQAALAAKNDWECPD